MIDVFKRNPDTGALTGEVRWAPHVHVKDTVDFCPGNQGGAVAQQLTLPLSKLEAGGLVRDVPITVDYDLAARSRQFADVIPRAVDAPVPPPRRKRPRAADERPCR